jgi:acetoin utilization deacetylase AcuC-like enzyme
MLGNLALTVNGFFMLSKTIRDVAEKVCHGKVILMPGSGYNPTVLPQCWYALAAGIVGLETIDVKDPYSPPAEPERILSRVKELVRDLKGTLKPYWKCFK